MTNNTQNQTEQKIIVQHVSKETNGLGTTGFVLSLISLFIGWIPYIGWIIWILGLIFSFIGVFKKPAGLAIAGLVISLIGIILLIVVFGTIIGLAAHG